MLSAGASAVGVDVSSVMADLARRNAPTAVVQHESIYDFLRRTTDSEFDAAVAFLSLIVLPKSEHPWVFDQVRRILRPGGVFVVSFVQGTADWTPFSFMGQPVKGSSFAVEELRVMAERAGFDVVRMAVEPFVPCGDLAEPETHVYCYCRKPLFQSPLPSIEVKPLGIVHSSYVNAAPSATKIDFAGVVATIEIFPEYRDALVGVDGMLSVFIVFLFHRALDQLHLQASPHGGQSRGVFTTCCPGRPNHLGVTSVSVISVDVARGELVVQGLDAVDGTPVLDVRPNEKKPQ
jgi:tRNA-Thr(GGU) m(6)t(6)A37 methyltransferase TsaA